MPYHPQAHPRSAGTFTRVLGLYVREKGTLSLMDALRKMTILPARRVESAAPEMTRRGRLRVGAYADITVFDQETVRDTASYEDGMSFAAGIEYVLVNSVFIIRDTMTVKGAMPGRAIRTTTRAPAAR